MRILILFFICLAFTACNTERQWMRQAKKDVKTLSSDEFHGRGYTHNGLQKAEEFIQKSYREIGLEPVYPNYKQAVSYPVNILQKVDLKIDGNERIFGTDYLVGPNSESDTIHSSVFYIPDHLFDFSAQDGKETFKLLSLNTGKIPVIDFRNATDSLKQNLFAFSRYLDQEKNHYQFPAIIQVHDKLIHGVSNHQDNFIHIFLKEMPQENSKIELSVQATLDSNFETHNLVGKVAGTQNDSALLVMAHFDHLGQINNSIFYGANDNASGTSMLLQLARYFKKNPSKNDIYFYAMTGEEAGLKGAKEAARNLPIDKSKIKFVLNLDILGTGDEGIQVVNSRVFKDAYQLLNKINKEQQLVQQIKLRGEACNSDHCPFHQMGIPNFFVYTLGGISAYHHPLDKSETLPLTAFYDVYELLRQFLEQL